MIMRRSGYHKLYDPVAVILAAMLMCTVFALAAGTDVFASPTVTVVIDPGHGGKSEDENETNSGCKYHGLEEKDLTLVTGLAMYDELSQYGNVDVYMTRDVDAPLTLERRVEFAEEVNADVIISIHYNASADHNFFGSEIFTSAYGECYGTGHALAEKIMDEWVAEGNIRKDIKTRLGKNGDYYGLIRQGTARGIPTIILEHGYLDNDRDYLRIKNKEAWVRFGIMDATAVAKFYGLEKDIVKESIGPDVEIESPEDPVRPDDSGPEGVRLEIGEYNSNKGDVEFTLYASDDESKLMYYGFKTGDVDKDTPFEELELWDGKKGKVTGTYHLQPGYKGKLTAKVYNVYQVDTLSNTVELEPDEEAPDDEKDNAVIEDETAVQEEEETAVSEQSEEAGEEWVIGGDLPAVDNTAVANAIDKNTGSKVKDSYYGLLAVGLIAAIVIVVTVVLSLSFAAEKRKRRKRSKKGRDRDAFDWADRYGDK